MLTDEGNPLNELLPGLPCLNTFGVPSSVASGATFPHGGKVILVSEPRRLLRQCAHWLVMTDRECVPRWAGAHTGAPLRHHKEKS